MTSSDWLNRFWEVLTDSADPRIDKIIQVEEEFRGLYPSVTNRAGLLMALLYEACTGITHTSGEYLYLYNPVSEILRRTREVVPLIREHGGKCPHCGRSDGIVGCAVSVPFGDVAIRCIHCIEEVRYE